MKATVETIREIVKVLTTEEQQLLKDTFLFGAWGDTETEFLDEEGKVEIVGAWGYCTNDAREGGHFAGRVVSTMFRSIYKKLCTANRHQIGTHLSHCNDWWGDGSGDMLFVRSAWNKAWMEWAKAPIQPEEPKNEESAADYVRRISDGELKQWLFQFNTEGGDYLGRVIISSAKMPTTQEAVAEFAKTAPLAAKLVGKYGAEIITDKEERLGDVPVGSIVYSNINRRTYKIVKRCKNYTEVFCVEETNDNNTRMMKNDYLVVVKRCGEGKDLFTGALVDRVKATTNQERNDYNFLVDFTDTDEGVEMSISRTGSAWKSSVYTREQLRQLSDAINAYLAK